jgi:hypothetical protein
LKFVELFFELFLTKKSATLGKLAFLPTTPRAKVLQNNIANISDQIINFIF